VQAASLLLWLFLRSILLPHEPASLTLPANPLPSSRSAYGWLETTAPQIVSSEFDAGGTLVGRPAKIGVHGTSAVDTTFRFAGLDATSTLRPGTPMVLPDVVGTASIDVTRMASDISENAPGPVVEWRPFDGTQRVGVIEGFFMPSRFAVKPSATGAQPVSQLQTLSDGSIVLGGDVAPGRANALLSAHWAKATGIETATAFEGRQLSLLGAVTFTPSADERLQFIVNSQSASRTSLDDRYGAAQFSWYRGAAGSPVYRAAGGYQWLNIAPAGLPSLTMDSALDGSVTPRLFQPAGRERAWKFSADLTKPFDAMGLKQRFQFGGAVDRSAITPELAAAGSVIEYVNGTSARLWVVDKPSTSPRWTVSNASAFAAERIGSESIWLEGGVRIDHLNGDNGGTTAISWTNLFAHVAAEISDKRTGAGVFGSYTRVGSRLPPMALAWGDVNAPSARVYRRIESDPPPVPFLVARVGPGAAGGLTRISPDLVRPTYDVAIGGLKFDRPRFAIGISAVIRTAKHSIGAVNDTPSNYSAVTQPDKNADFTDASDDQPLTGYNRNVATFGLDSYTLTNLAGAGENSIYAFDFTAQYRGKRARLALSAAAVAAKGTAASRGFRVDENDPMLIGDAFANPNASVNAAGGRTFFDRGYVGKIAAAFDLPARISLGIVTRYQDGQPFSRLAIFTNLNQGPEAVAAYRNGRPTRFTYISTTDVRLQKAAAFGSKQLTLIADGFNVFNIGREVAEHVIGDANFRKTSLIEPPRTIRVGVRIAF
jgi:hypothetical protein